MKLIVGLGNPGRLYARNRHNAGFQCLDYLAHRHGLPFTGKRFRAELASGSIDGVDVLLAKPQTFMNLSGEAVRALAGWYRLTPDQVLVVYDDMDLPLGTIRLRPSGSAGGQKGMASVLERLGRQDVARLRVGIGRPERGDAMDHVLNNFRADEQRIMDEVYPRVADAIECWLVEGTTAAMNQFNH